MKKILNYKIVCFLLILSMSQLYGQTITGPIQVNMGEVVRYTFSDPSSTYFPGGWESDGVLLTDEGQGYLPYMDAKWDTAGMHYIEITYFDNSGNIVDYIRLDVEVLLVEAPTPLIPRVQSNTMGVVTLAWALYSAPPGHVTWYWQSTSDGTSMANSNSTINLTSGTIHYLRSRNNTTGVWSTNASSVNYTIAPPPTWYYDSDGDGFGNSSPTIISYTQPSGYVNNDNDSCPDEAGTFNGCILENNENYIQTIRYQKPYLENAVTNTVPKTDKIETIGYFDGLGRPKQNIAIRAGGDSEDIVTHIDYDAFGRQVKDYLPYAIAKIYNNDGVYKDNSLSSVNSFYNITEYENTTNPYSEKLLEASPLNRVLKQAAPGNDWELNSGHEIKLDYQVNVANEVKLFNANTSWNASKELYDISLGNSTGTVFYQAGQLYKTVTKDENWIPSQTNLKDHTTEVFKNKQGQIVLKRSYNGNVTHDTHYVFDQYGNLTYVIPPLAADMMLESSSNYTQNSTSSSATVTDGETLNLTASSSITLTNGFHARSGSTFTASITSGSTNTLDELCYQYKYDSRNRLVEKKLPGKGWESIVYDKLDRPILTHDANSKWLFTKYDVFDRPVYTGEYLVNQSRKELQAVANNTTLFSEEKQVIATIGDATAHYSNQAFPNTNIKLYTINYYDNYDFDLDGGVSEVVGASTAIKSLATGSKVRILGTNNWITNVIYYDDKGRPIYNYSKNNFLNTVDKVKTELDFIGKVIKTTATHAKTAKATITLVDNFTYDQAGRLTKQTQAINGAATPEVIVENSYDELGQLYQKKVGGKTTQSRLQTVDYTYNIRGWLKGINDSDTNNNAITMGTGDLFGFQINYNDGPTDPLKKLYNGNISQTYWKTTNPIDSNLRNYNYSYDALNRLTGAQYSLTTPNRYNENLTYDKNGNIKSLIRTGNTDANGSIFGSMDNLIFTYLGNRLNTVEDTSGSTEGFKDGSHTAQEYTYDANGNTKTDNNKGITAIAYNHLNLPTDIILAEGTIHYDYDATGVKQRKIAPGITTDYAGGFQYKNNDLQFFPTTEGYVKHNTGTFSYIYQYKDHLGNVRLSYGDTNNDGVVTTAEIIEESSYYPFGMKHTGYGYSQVVNSDYKYKYNGKELQDELGLNVYDYGARTYMPDLGRWMQSDPLVNDLDFTFNPNDVDEDDITQVKIAYHTTLGNGGGIYNRDNLNPYTYGYNDPVRFDDPDGRCPNCFTAIAGALIGGGIELGGQLLSGKSLGDVDWADVGVEALKGGLIGSGAGAGGAALLEGGSIVAKASFDYTNNGKAKNILNGKKSRTEAAFDGVADVVGGKIGGAVGKKIGNLTERAVKTATKAETKATKEVAKATNKFNKATDGGRNMSGSKSMIAKNTLEKAKGGAQVARGNTVRAQMTNSATKGVSGEVVNKAAENSITDKVKKFFGF